MRVQNIPVSKVFTGYGGEPIGDLPIPAGKYKKNDEDDLSLTSLVPVVDKTFQFNASILKPLLLAFHFRHNILIVGPTGIGKTMSILTLAGRLRLPLTRIPCDGDVGRTELLGYLGLPDPKNPDDDGYKYPSLVTGIQRPGVVLLDEWDALRPEASISLQPLLEDHDPGVLLIERDEYVRKHPDCIICATANTRGLGDETGLFAGTQPQNFAQLNRFHVVVPVEPVKAEHLRIILDGKNLEVDSKILDAIIGFYDGWLSANKQGNIDCLPPIRLIEHFARYYSILGPSTFKLIVAEKIPSERDKRALEQIAVRFNLVEA